MVPEYVDRTRGSNRPSALPTGSAWQSALPTVDRTRGSRWQSALPTVDRIRGSRWQSALPTVDRTRGSSLVQAMPAVSRWGRALPGKEEILCELPGWVPPRC